METANNREVDIDRRNNEKFSQCETFYPLSATIPVVFTGEIARAALIECCHVAVAGGDDGRGWDPLDPQV